MTRAQTEAAQTSLSLVCGSSRVPPHVLRTVAGHPSEAETRNRMELFLHFRNRLQREEGQDLPEYALLIGLIALVVIGAVAVLGENMSGIYYDLGSRVGTW